MGLSKEVFTNQRDYQQQESMNGDYYNQDLRPACEMVSYSMTMKRLEEGTYVSDHAMKHDVIDSGKLIWIGEELIEMGIKKARKRYEQRNKV